MTIPFVYKFIWSRNNCAQTEVELDNRTFVLYSTVVL